MNWERLVTLGLVTLIIFSPLFRAALPIWAISFVYLVILVTSVIWLVRIKEDREFSFIRTPLDFPILFFILFASLATVSSINVHRSVSALYRLISYSLVYFLVTNNIKDREEIVNLVWSILAVSVFVALYGLREFFTHNFTPPSSTFPNQNVFASFLLIPLSLAGGLLLFDAKKRKIEKLALGIMILLFLAAMVTTKSRGTFLCLIPVVGLLGYLKSRRYAAITLVLVILLFTLFPTPHSSPVFRLLTGGGEDPYTYTRLSIWKSALAMLRDYPLLGTGPGTFQDAFSRYSFPVEGVFARFGKKALFAHNEYLQIASEMGIFALGIFIWLFSSFFRKVAGLLKDFRSREGYGLVVGLTTGIAGLLIHSLVDFPLHAPAVALILTINTGILMGLGSAEGPPLLKKRRRIVFLETGRYYLYLVLLVLILGYAIFAPYWADSYAKEAERVKGNNPLLSIHKLQKATGWDPLSGAYHLQLANLYIRLYRETRDDYYRIAAYKELQEAIELEEKNGYYRRSLAKFYDQEFTGHLRVDLIVHEMQKAIELQPHSCFLHYELASIYAREGEYAEAIGYYKKAIELEPNYSQAHYRLGDIYRKLGRNEAAREEYECSEETKKAGLRKSPRTPYEDQLISFSAKTLDR
jgi:putative inorganic carbon (HCO3(-)) transporter